MKYTLLEMVQAILASMNSDEVDSYSDTAESLDVARVIKESYYEIVRRLDLPRNHAFFTLTASGDSDKPVLMTMPEDVADVDYVKYKKVATNGDAEWYKVEFVPLEVFMERTLGLNESESNVDTMTISQDGTSFTIKFMNDRNPSFYTSVDDNTLLFDAHLDGTDDTLMSSKTMCYGKKIPTFTFDDDYVPQLEPEQFGLLLEEAKVQAWYEIKSAENKHAEGRRRKNWQHTQKTKLNVQNRQPGYRNYGRRVP